MADESRRNKPAPDRPETALGEGLPPNVDIHRLGEGDNPQADWDEPAEGEDVAYGGNHNNRPRKTEAQVGQGPRTIQRNKDIARGRLYR